MWRPKPPLRYTDLVTNDIDDDLFEFRKFGKSLKRSTAVDVPPRDDIHLWNEERDHEELHKNLRVGSGVDDTTRERLTTIIKSYWDCFYEEGARRPILGFEFCIDTGSAQPVSIRQPKYGPHESKIIMTHIESLLHNGWIKECAGPWSSGIVLAAKPHQEHITDINQFIWRMCVSYRKLNSVTKPFEFPIPRCAEAVEDLGDASGRIYFISVDARQGFHQIRVRECDQEKLAFFGPDGKKYTFVVMPFGPMNG
ncbi:MAG: reverse transcriptase family protein, partial [bacterium]